MNIIVLHNAYKEKGGEDVVVSTEVAALRAAGHQVHLEIVANDLIADPISKIKTLIRAPYDPAREKWAAELVTKHRAEIVHVHNFFPLLSPAVHRGAKLAGARVVQTLHNYRPICAGAFLVREGSPCRKCIDQTNLWAAAHRCYRNSIVGSLAIVEMQNQAKRRGWVDDVDTFIALSEAQKAEFVAAGFPSKKIVVKPNAVDIDHSSISGDRLGGLFVGRLSTEKGVDVLLSAWRDIPELPLTIIGDGPERGRLEAAAPRNVTFRGRLSQSEVHAAMRSAEFLVVPSIWPEAFGLVAIEAFGNGLPVIASDIGALSEIVSHGVDGFLFESPDSKKLYAAIDLLLKSNNRDSFHKSAINKYTSKYTIQINTESLIAIYSRDNT